MNMFSEKKGIPELRLPPSSSRLLTFGYEGLDLDKFIQHLQDHGVNAVVDVREIPLSRKKGFSKTAFSNELNAAGISYRHVPALGCPKPIRDRYRLDGDWAKYTKDFWTYLETQNTELRDLAGFSQHATACLVCFEADYSSCHRTYVARAAHQLGGAEVWHLLSHTKRAIPDQRLRIAA